ncbi:protein kinase domain-containing protein [Almyronema epifaneia]|uniref:non-specific serine/threonine protein kinase n=1 Tax=Almyronema epifaneia S1 TaxID=2991925 RepID=A0ABW6ID57_9CYAN
MQKPSPSQLSDFQTSAHRNSQLRNLCRSGQLFRDRYRILKVLGRGGFGVTFLAQDAALPGSPLCVIKQLSPKVRNSLSLERAKIRFRREARILSQLGSHSQVPMLLDYFTIKGEFYLVQEFVQGDTLAREVRRSGIHSELQVKQFLKEILPVIQYIHHQRVIHRDIKPPNIIRCRDYQRLVLIDFGAVRECLAEADEAGYRAPTTQFVGTIGFAPPEQLALRPTYASDIYALGVTCLYLLTGRSPIEFDTYAESGELRWQKSVQLSAHFSAILTKMLKPDVRDRYQQIEEVQRALELEPYFSSLSDCLNTQPRTNPEIDTDELTPMDSYLTPIQRRAAAIRSWRSRRKSKEATRPRHGLPSSLSFPL